MGVFIRLLAAYLLGAFPTSILVGKAVRGVDIRNHGSGNAGATNAWRVLGWRSGLAVLAVDMAKGAAAAMAVSRIPVAGAGLDLSTLALLCGVAAVIGHVFPVYTRFRGGKGVATAGGMLFAVAPIPMSVALGVFILAVVASGRISLGSLGAAVAIPVSSYALPMPSGARHPQLLLVLTSLLAAFIFWTHRRNLVRLWRGEERVFPQLQLWRRWLR